MNVLHVVPFLPRASGVSVFACGLARELTAAGHGATLAVARRAADDFPVDASVRTVDLPDVLDMGVGAFDVVHVHGLWSFSLHRAAAAARKAGVPVVLSPHGMLRPWALRHKFLKKRLALALYQGRDLRRAALVHVTAQPEADDVRRMGSRAPVVVAPLGVEHAAFAAAPIPLRRASRTVLFVGRLHPVKGLPNLLAAWARLPDAMRMAWRLRIVGADEGGHLAFLRARCRALALAEGSQIVFAGPKYGEELAREYADAALLVLPSLSENFGGVVVDALSRGVPAIASKATPWAELEAARCGWWTEGDARSLSEALRCAMSLSDDERAEMGARGRALAAAKYTWRATCATMLAAYARLRT